MTLTSRSLIIVALLACTLTLGVRNTAAQSSSKHQTNVYGFEFFGNKPRVDLAHAYGPRIGLVGTSAISVPTAVGPRRALRFGLQSGVHSALKVGDDRDPQHGFRYMLSIDPGGKLSLAGASKTLRLEPNKRYEIELHWSWSGIAMRIESVRVRRQGQADLVLLSGETRLGHDASKLQIRHSGNDTSWLDGLQSFGR